MKFIYLSFSKLLVGTYALTKKKSRTADDFPFAKLSNGALKSIPRGWKRMARQKIMTPNSKTRSMYTVQATVWKDKKLVGFLHNYLVANTDGHTVERWLPQSKKRKAISSHKVTTDYSYHMNGVDHKDRDTADWTVSLKSNRFYLQIFYWLFDGVLHAMYSIVKWVASSKSHPWHKYRSKHLGRYKFQMDLANELISRGIEMDWSDIEDVNNKPVYMRKQDYLPCSCKACFFCKNRFTHGVDHKKNGKGKQRRSRSGLSECPVERANVTTNPTRCAVCYTNQRALNPTVPGSKVDKLCSKTRQGCMTCGVNVCAKCWKTFEHAML